MASVDCVQYFVERVDSLEGKLRTGEHLSSLSSHLSLVKSLCEIVTHFDTDVRRVFSELKSLLYEVKASAGQDGGVKLDYELVKNGSCFCHCHQSVEKCENASQTVEVDEKSRRETGLEGPAGDWQPPEGSNVTVADLVKQAAEDALANTDYVFNEEYQMYYSLSSGYYYDPASRLFYEPNSGTYYSYDAERQAYEFHSRVEPTKAETKRKQRSKRTSKKKRRRPRSDEDEDSLEEGEVGGSSGSSSGTCSDSDEEMTESYPPCIRFVVKESESLQRGSILMVAFPGATVGQLSSHGLCVPDSSVSKNHAEITFNAETNLYELGDVGSTNHTFVNGAALERGVRHPLGHLDTVKFGTCVLQAHIHERTQTCGHCEPGLLQAEAALPTSGFHEVLSKSDKEKQRRAELKRIKKKYSLENAGYVEPGARPTKGYVDRARGRRETVGSNFPHERDAEPSAVDRALPADNKGFQMLQKMGWKEGKGLGKEQQGTTEPVAVEVRRAQVGLGAERSAATPPDPKTEVWKKTQERYHALT